MLIYVTVHECSLDGPLQTLRFLFRYEIQNGGYGRMQFGFICPSGFREEAFLNIFPIGSNVKLSPAVCT
jgi:hypothetical protein